MQRRSRLAVIAAVLLALGLEGSAATPVSDGFVGAFRWVSPDPRFGGLSGIELSADGSRFTVIGDGGTFVQGRIARSANGAIARIEAGPVTVLKASTGDPLDPEFDDSEGLAIAPDGSVYISFEGPAQVLHYDTISGPAKALPTPAAFRAFHRNAAFEALAVDAKGTIFTVPEELASYKRLRLLFGQPGNPNGPDFPVWRFANGAWTEPFVLPRRGSFLPVGADFGPDGRLYVLERDFRGIAGFGSQVRSFVVGPDALSDERTHLQTPPGMHDNLEGLSVWRDASGSLRLTMVSDNNFLPIQRTELVEYRLPD